MNDSQSKDLVVVLALCCLSHIAVAQKENLQIQTDRQTGKQSDALLSSLPLSFPSLFSFSHTHTCIVGM